MDMIHLDSFFNAANHGLVNGGSSQDRDNLTKPSLGISNPLPKNS
jgi:hypothetical protein